MLSVLLAANVADGHVAPMLGVAEQFAGSGHRVRFLAGDRFADAVRRTGAEFLPWPADAQVDHQAVIAEMAAEGGRPSGTRGIARSIDRIFIAPAPAQYAALREAIEAERTDAVLTEYTVVGAAALGVLGAGRARRSWRAASFPSVSRAWTPRRGGSASCPAPTLLGQPPQPVPELGGEERHPARPAAAGRAR